MGKSRALRDPRDCVLSAYKQRFGMNAAMFRMLTMPGAAAYYDAAMRAGAAALDRVPATQRIEIRYEDCVADLEAEARRLVRFLDLDWSDDVMAYRESRLISLADFNAMKDDPNTIILDTRSQFAFDTGHIDGAVHLNFSDFTDEKLAKVIPSKATRILIYCNNNFADNIDPVPVKRAPLALNIPTFINLVGYGYENVYELGELVTMEDEGVNWVSSLHAP